MGPILLLTGYTIYFLKRAISREQFNAIFRKKLMNDHFLLRETLQFYGMIMILLKYAFVLKL